MRCYTRQSIKCIISLNARFVGGFVIDLPESLNSPRSRGVECYMVMVKQWQALYPDQLQTAAVNRRNNGTLLLAFPYIYLDT